MANAEPMKLRIVAYQDGDAWAAQCIEYDIAVQASDFSTLQARMNVALMCEAEHTREKYGEAFAGIEPAPESFVAMFDAVSARVCNPDEPRIFSEADFRIAA